MNYSKDKLPMGAEKVGETPLLNQDNIFPGLLKEHMAPKGKWGHIVVESGSLNFVWEDTPEEILTADKEHNIPIMPERYHHVILTGDVEFRVEFYKVKEEEGKEMDKDAYRPGENFL